MFGMITGVIARLVGAVGILTQDPRAKGLPPPGM